MLEKNQHDRHDLFDRRLENSGNINIIIKSCLNMSIGEVNINKPFVNKRIIDCQTDNLFIEKGRFIEKIVCTIGKYL